MSVYARSAGSFGPVMAAADLGFGKGRFVLSPPFSSPSPPPSPHRPSPSLYSLPFPSHPFLFLSLPRPYPFPPSPPLRSRTPWLRLGDLGERYELPQRVRAEPGRQTLSGAFSAYLGAFWQVFSSNLSLVKLQLLTFSQFFFQIFPFRNVMLRRGLPYPQSPILPFLYQA